MSKSGCTTLSNANLYKVRSQGAATATVAPVNTAPAIAAGLRPGFSQIQTIDSQHRSESKLDKGRSEGATAAMVIVTPAATVAVIAVGPSPDSTHVKHVVKATLPQPP